MRKILVVVGTRPNFIKIALFRSLAINHGFELKIVHTGQHYDPALAEVFFRQLHITPDFLLEIPAGDPEQQIIMMQAKLSKLMAVQYRPDLVMVVGDVNSTRAAAEAAQIHNIPIAHIESGLRSFDQTMPEEINRIVADNLATYYFITEESGIRNLTEEGKSSEHMYLVGNTMIDTLMQYEPYIQSNTVLDEIGLTANNYALITLHRPSNVDTKEGLQQIGTCLQWLADQMPVVFPVHPRTKNRIAQFGLQDIFAHPSILCTEPQNYFAFQKLIADCTCVITDSGGVQEETTFRQKPCLTMRPNTERPVTIELGTNVLVENTIESLSPHIHDIRSGNFKRGIIPPLWDGKAGERIFQILDALR